MSNPTLVAGRGTISGVTSVETIKPKKSLVEETYDILLDAICSGEFSPGDRLNQDDIAARLQVSRQPVNSAIAILKAERLLEDTGRRSVIVAPLDPELMRAITEYRLLVEPFAASAAVARRPDKAAALAQKVLTRGREAVARGDIPKLLRADRAFHEMLYLWAGNQVIQNSMRQTWNHIQRAMVEILRDPGKAVAIWDEHDGIIGAILADDRTGAAERMTAHIQNAYDRNFALSEPAAETPGG
ncbi:GntR family transcriptional regulator [Marinovum sp.]|uniref:GntR family transcriptional regulator n=1 Tax=Marinovum sp. TaxID=2024839 RepID=UPI003A91B802